MSRAQRRVLSATLLIVAMICAAIAIRTAYRCFGIYAGLDCGDEFIEDRLLSPVTLAVLSAIAGLYVRAGGEHGRSN